MNVRLNDIIVVTSLVFIGDIDELKLKYETFCKGDKRGVNFNLENALSFSVMSSGKFINDEIMCLFRIPRGTMCEMKFLGGL